jgi:hypothetical protein
MKSNMSTPDLKRLHVGHIGNFNSQGPAADAGMGNHSNCLIFKESRYASLLLVRAYALGSRWSRLHLRAAPALRRRTTAPPGKRCWH